MRAGRINERRIAAPRKQRGVVLLIALIVLVAMTLAAIGMMRSVDTGNVIAGNLAFQQATSQASDAGTSKAFSDLISVTNSANAANVNVLHFDNGQPCASVPGATAAGCPGNGTINFPGYSSRPLDPCEVRLDCADASKYTWWTVDANWAGVPFVTVTDPNGGGTIATVKYLIHRMCTDANAVADKLKCLTQPNALCSKKPPVPPCPTAVIYRITSRSEGVRNTVTYTQTLVTNTENLP